MRLGLSGRPIKPCKDMTTEELLEEELWHRLELTRLVLSLSIHIGTCTTHGVLSAGTTLPIHLPVVVFIAYKLTKVALRHRAIRAEARINRRNIQFRKISSSRGKRLTDGIVLMILTPIFSAIGADIVNDIICAVAGTDLVKIVSIGSSSSSSTVAFGECSIDQSGTDIILYEGDGRGMNVEKNDISVCGEAIIEKLVEIWSQKLIHSAPDEFTQLVEEIDLNSRAKQTLPSHYQCYDCFVGVKHQDVKRHPYIEFKVQEEISQIQRIMVSLQRETVIVEHGRGSHTKCNVCHSMISEPTKIGRRTEMSTYYRCEESVASCVTQLIPSIGKSCPDFDICTKCFPTEAAKAIHEDHKFNMIVATDDEATISRLSPTTDTRSPSDSFRSGSSGWVQTPVGSPEPVASPTLPSSRSHSNLFTPTPWMNSPTSPTSPPPIYSSVFPENVWHRGQHFACDACYCSINDDKRLSCVE
ncbi:ZZ domain-containing protein [Rhizoctonia solani AG-1 IA]|uniref:ZZ domain-containing protein n=1 Tax=Thanatephorus cucumeris (strain AG1-IA) TaxID=983506 RepID=L8WKU4_THACA|nr:ZZ domain-containing protein [Rhizoctonia solani AG-1 IA]